MLFIKYNFCFQICVFLFSSSLSQDPFQTQSSLYNIPRQNLIRVPANTNILRNPQDVTFPSPALLTEKCGSFVPCYADLIRQHQSFGSSSNGGYASVGGQQQLSSKPKPSYAPPLNPSENHNVRNSKTLDNSHFTNTVGDSKGQTSLVNYPGVYIYRSHESQQNDQTFPELPSENPMARRGASIQRPVQQPQSLDGASGNFQPIFHQPNPSLPNLPRLPSLPVPGAFPSAPFDGQIQSSSFLRPVSLLAPNPSLVQNHPLSNPDLQRQPEFVIFDAIPREMVPPEIPFSFPMQFFQEQERPMGNVGQRILPSGPFSSELTFGPFPVYPNPELKDQVRSVEVATSLSGDTVLEAELAVPFNIPTSARILERPEVLAEFSSLTSSARSIGGQQRLIVPVISCFIIYLFNQM